MKIEMLQFGPTGWFVFRTRINGEGHIMGYSVGKFPEYRACNYDNRKMKEAYATEEWYHRKNPSPFYIEVNDGKD